MYVYLEYTTEGHTNKNSKKEEIKKCIKKISIFVLFLIRNNTLNFENWKKDNK